MNSVVDVVACQNQQLCRDPNRLSRSGKHSELRRASPRKHRLCGKYAYYASSLRSSLAYLLHMKGGAICDRRVVFLKARWCRYRYTCFSNRHSCSCVWRQCLCNETVFVHISVQNTPARLITLSTQTQALRSITASHYHRIHSSLNNWLEQTESEPSDDPHTHALCALSSYQVIHVCINHNNTLPNT